MKNADFVMIAGFCGDPRAFERDQLGGIMRVGWTATKFKQTTGYPRSRLGYVINQVALAGPPHEIGVYMSKGRIGIRPKVNRFSQGAEHQRAA